MYGRDYFLQQDFDPKILSVFAAHKNDFILCNFHASGVNSRSCAFLQSRKLKSEIDFDLKIADRFSYENRIPISRSVGVVAVQTGFQSLIDFKMKNADRF